MTGAGDDSVLAARVGAKALGVEGVLACGTRQYVYDAVEAKALLQLYPRVKCLQTALVT
jgi:hypothetical protein